MSAESSLQVTTVASMPVDITKTRLQSQKVVNGGLNHDGFPIILNRAMVLEFD